MKAAEKASLYRELAKLTAADFHIDRSLALLLGQKSGKARRRYLQGMQTGLAEGKSIAESISSGVPFVNGLEASLIAAGERSGRLADAFTHLARYFAAADAATKQARAASIYPIILAHLAIVLPALPAAIMGQTGNPIGRVVLSIGAVWLALFVLGALWRLLSGLAVKSALWDRVLCRLPIVGPVRRHWSLARFTLVFHSGLLAALRMSEILELAGQASQSGRLRHASHKAARTIATAGQSLTDAMAATHDFPEEFVFSVATAEHTGSLDVEMLRWAEVETASATEAINRASVWLPRIGYGLVVLFVLYQIASMVQGYYGGILRQLENF